MSSLDGVNAVTIIFAALCVFAIGYRFYGLFIAVFTLCYNAVERKARHIAAKHAATTEVVKEAE